MFDHADEIVAALVLCLAAVYVGWIVIDRGSQSRAVAKWKT